MTRRGRSENPQVFRVWPARPLQARLSQAEGKEPAECASSAEQQSVIEEAVNCITVLTVGRADTGKLSLEIKGRQVDFIVDTGACRTLISQAEWDRLGQPKLDSCSICLKSTSGHAIRTKETLRAAEPGGSLQRHRLRGDRTMNLLGTDWIKKMSNWVNWTKLMMGLSAGKKQKYCGTTAEEDPLHYQQPAQPSPRPATCPATPQSPPRPPTAAGSPVHSPEPSALSEERTNSCFLLSSCQYASGLQPLHRLVTSLHLGIGALPQGVRKE